MATEQGKCISQLKEVFDSCDENRSGYLGLDGLKSLCRHLQLTEQADLLVQKLLKGDDDAEVDFEVFKEGFISLLTQSEVTDDDNESEDEGHVQSASEREVSPKFVLGSKKYGRRSRPASMVESSMSVDSQEPCSTEPDTTQDRVRPSLLKSYSEPSNSYSEACTSALSTPEHLSRVISRTPSCHSQLDQEGTQWNSPEEFLRALWKRLQVGKDGYLNQDELACVCNNIGMEASPETIRQLFEKLDTNHDGNVTFDELLQGLFQHEGPESSSKSETSFTCSPVNHHIYKGSSQEDMQICEPSRESSIFSSIDLNNEGYVSASSLAELWESLSFNNGLQILQELGFNVKLKINVHDLTLLLEEELTSACSDPIYQVALLTLQNELQYIRTSLAQIRAERNKLKYGLLEANNRAALLAQEIDEHHAKLEESSQQQIQCLEKRYQEQLRDLQEELRKERETLTNQIAGLKQELEDQMDEMQDLEANFKRQLSLNEIENSRLESELQDVIGKCSELESRNIILQKELDSMAEVRQKLQELESSRGYVDSADKMNSELEELRRENKDLQDHTDQLTIEIEQLKQLVSSTGQSTTKRHNRINSWLADYNKGLNDMSNGSGLKRRGSASSSDGISEDENRMVSKIRRRLSISSGKDKINLESFEPDDDQGIILDVRRSSLRMDQDCLNVSHSSSSLQKYTEAEPNPFEEMTKQLTEDLNIKSQIIAEKDAIISQLKHDFQQYLTDQNLSFEKQKLKLPGNKKAEITVTIQDLQRLMKSVVQSSNVTQTWLQKSIDERFAKICKLIELDCDKPESDYCLGESKLGRQSGPDTETYPSPTDKLLKDLYVENARLMKELQLAEQQQRRAEQSNGRMQYKCKVLTKLLADITNYTTKQMPPI